MPKGELVLSVTLKDCEVQHFRCGGPGGQGMQKSSNAARVIHRASGARGESRESRSQLANKKTAFKRMVATPAFQAWLKRQLGQDLIEEAELTRRVNAKLERDMRPENIRVELHETGEWVVVGSG